MNLAHLLNARRAAGSPVNVALIGAGKFGSMFLSQVPHTPGLEVPVIVDLDPERAREACRTVGWDAGRIAATTFTADAAKATSDNIEVIVEATGNPAVGIRHARAAIAAGKHIVMVNVEADVLAGPLLAEEARQRRRGLFAGLWRPAGAHRRDGGLGARHRLSRRRRRQGHQIPAGLSRRDAGGRLEPLRADGGRGAIGRHESADVQLVSRRHQIGDRNGGDCQCHRAGRAGGRAVVSALRRRRPAACDAAARRGRRAGEIRRGRSGVVAGARRPAGVPRPALGRLCRAGSAERLRRRLLQAVRAEDRFQRPLCGDVQAVSSDRAAS